MRVMAWEALLELSGLGVRILRLAPLAESWDVDLTTRCGGCGDCNSGVRGDRGDLSSVLLGPSSSWSEEK